MVLCGVAVYVLYLTNIIEQAFLSLVIDHLCLSIYTIFDGSVQ